MYQHQLLKLGDELSRMKVNKITIYYFILLFKCYNLAINHGYGRYLRTIVTDPSNVLLTINESKTESQLTLTVRPHTCTCTCTCNCETFIFLTNSYTCSYELSLVLDIVSIML